MLKFSWGAETAQGTKGVLGSENHVKRKCELPDSALTTLRARPPIGIVKSPLVVSAKKHTAILSKVLRPGGQGTINNFGCWSILVQNTMLKALSGLSTVPGGR